MKAGLPFCDILKVSEEELPLLTGETDAEKGLAALHAAGPAVVALTMGPQGCIISNRSGYAHCPTYNTKVVDTTGSGDSFFGAFLSCVLKSGKAPAQLTLEELKEFAAYGNAAGSTCATAAGAIPALPGDDAIRACMATVPLLK